MTLEEHADRLAVAILIVGNRMLEAQADGYGTDDGNLLAALSARLIVGQSEATMNASATAAGLLVCLGAFAHLKAGGAE